MNFYSTLVIATIPALFSFIVSYLAFILTLAKHKRLIMPELAVKKYLAIRDIPTGHLRPLAMRCVVGMIILMN
jgi:hypothetical protein